MNLSFDFDDTLSIPLVQDYCKSLIDIGVDVYVITYRCNEFSNVKLLNLDLYEVTDRLGINRDKVILAELDKIDLEELFDPNRGSLNLYKYLSKLTDDQLDELAFIVTYNIDSIPQNGIVEEVIFNNKPEEYSELGIYEKSVLDDYKKKGMEGNVKEFFNYPNTDFIEVRHLYSNYILRFTKDTVKFISFE